MKGMSAWEILERIAEITEELNRLAGDLAAMIGKEEVKDVDQ